MRNLLIIGARGYGREIYNMALNSLGYNEEFVIKGFLDDKKDALDEFKGYPPIIDSVEEYEISEGDVFICALGDVTYKKKYIEKILEKGGQFINIIHKQAIIYSNVVLGKGIIIAPFAYISCDTIINNFVSIQPHVTIGHDAEIGEYSHLNTYSFMGGFSELKDSVTLHTGAIILPKKIVQSNTIVGAASVVIKNVPENVSVHGNPAKRLF